jgi:hypothetical protein
MSTSPYTKVGEAEEPSDSQVVEFGRDWLFLSNQLGMCLRRCGWDVRGWSFSLSRDKTLLTVRVLGNDLPQVVFISCRTPTDCVSTLKRKYNAGTLTFYPDKYA